ncbi:unnamed protein product [Prorocentrum cordatum]|uniref:Peroxisomal membrane protein PEX16 n=1 Tax=Prorocentrum cordatum TaxID=2364126 RepID=A0ABN9XNI6_9DINO|nr:unnamed protein product [Polarella glacialis]
MAARPAEAEGPDDPPWNATPRAARSPCAPRLEVGSARTSSSSLGGGGSLGDWWLEEEAPRAQPRGALRAQASAGRARGRRRRRGGRRRRLRVSSPSPPSAALGSHQRPMASCGDSVGLPGHSRASGGCGTGSNASPGALARAAPADSGLPKRLALLSAALLEILGDLAWAATAAARTQQTQRGAALLCSWSSSRMASGSLGALGEPVSGRAPSGQ